MSTRGRYILTDDMVDVSEALTRLFQVEVAPQPDPIPSHPIPSRPTLTHSFAQVDMAPRLDRACTEQDSNLFRKKYCYMPKVAPRLMMGTTGS